MWVAKVMVHVHIATEVLQIFNSGQQDCVSLQRFRWWHRQMKTLLASNRLYHHRLLTGRSFLGYGYLLWYVFTLLLEVSTANLNLRLRHSLWVHDLNHTHSARFLVTSMLPKISQSQCMMNSDKERTVCISVPFLLSWTYLLDKEFKSSLQTFLSGGLNGSA